MLCGIEARGFMTTSVRVWLVLLPTAVLGLGGAQSALAVTCGQAEQAGTAPTQGTLTLDAGQSNTSWKDGTGDDAFLLYFKVSGCSLVGTSGVSATVRASNGKLRKALGSVELAPPKSSTLVVTVPVAKGDLPAG